MPRRAQRTRVGVDAPALSSETTKTYDLSEPDRRTAGYLRRVLQQKDIPAAATVTLDTNRITILWTE